MLLPSTLLGLIFSTLLPLVASDEAPTLTERVVQTQQVHRLLDHQPASNTDCRQKPIGPIDATECNYETIETTNEELFSSLHDIVQAPFFRYYKVELYRECPFWDDNDICGSKDCVITPVDESQIPDKWKSRTLSNVEKPSLETKESLPGCYYRDSDFCFSDDDTAGDFIDLLDNPERFTGYAGKAARSVWKAIYEENCFGMRPGTIQTETYSPLSFNPLAQLAPQDDVDTDGECLEKRVYYKIISGLHASISTHLCYEYLDQDTGKWGPNLECFIERVANNPERLEYIYFNTVIVLRAISRAAIYLSNYDMCDGLITEHNSASEDEMRSKLANILNLSSRVGKFDESILFQGENRALKEEFKDHFRNVTRIMDCVGCMRCRLWGKVQTSGVATALKILFELDWKNLDHKANPNLLQRSEVVALINTAHRFTESIHMVNEFRRLWAIAENREVILDRVEENIKNPPPPRASPRVGEQEQEDEPFPHLVFESQDTIYDRVIKVSYVCKAGTFWCLKALVNFGRHILRGFSTLFTVSSKGDFPHDDL